MNTNQDLVSLKRQYKRASVAYYNADKPIMTDAAFNKLEDQIRKLDPSWKELSKTGVKVADKKTERPLVKFMPSLNKMYPDAVSKFYATKAVAGITAWLWMDKLDGTSLQVVYEGGKPVKFFTRGDGINGGDISFFIPTLVKLKRIPATIPEKGQVVLRLEGLMAIKTFEKKWSREAKGKHGFDNIRNMVNGLFNKKGMHPALADVDLVVLGIYDMPLYGGLMSAAGWGFTVVTYQVIKGIKDAAAHGKALEGRRKSSIYEMDGLVVAPLKFTMDYEDAEKPKQLRAFKFNDEENAAQVVVEDIIWQKTRLKRWIPKINIKPTKMDGVMVTNATAHNAKWMKERGIGPGAVVKVLRSGGVIPKIVGVVKKAKFKEPPEAYFEKGVHFVMAVSDTTSDVRGLHFFMSTLGIELLALKTLRKLYDHGFTTPESYIKLAHAPERVAMFSLKHAELGAKQTPKLLAELRRVLCDTVPLKRLMVASGCFEQGGMGRRKLEQLEDAGISMARLCNMRSPEILSTVTEVKGFSDKTAKILSNGVKVFREWYRPLKGTMTVDGALPTKAKVITGGKLSGVNVAWTSYRDKDQEAKVTANGGTVVTYGAKMNVLLYKEGAKFVGKIEKAGDKAMTWETFTKKYGVE